MLCTLVQVYVYAQVHADFHVQVVDCVFCVVSDLGYECPGAEGGGGGPGVWAWGGGWWKSVSRRNRNVTEEDRGPFFFMCHGFLEYWQFDSLVLYYAFFGNWQVLSYRIFSIHLAVFFTILFLPSLFHFFLLRAPLLNCHGSHCNCHGGGATRSPQMG